MSRDPGAVTGGQTVIERQQRPRLIIAPRGNINCRNRFIDHIVIQK